MKVLLTGSSGRIGRAIFNALIPHHAVTGLDRSPFSTTSVLGDVADAALLRTSLQDVDAVVHTASLHAPHVGMASDAEFHRVNVEGLQTLCRLAKEAGVKRIVYTSTTALYGGAIAPGACTWVDETLPPRPKTIYHRTKLDAERILESEASATSPSACCACPAASLSRPTRWPLTGYTAASMRATSPMHTARRY